MKKKKGKDLNIGHDNTPVKNEVCPFLGVSCLCDCQEPDATQVNIGHAFHRSALKKKPFSPPHAQTPPPPPHSRKWIDKTKTRDIPSCHHAK